MEKLEIEEGRVGRRVQKLQKYNETNLSKLFRMGKQF